MDGDDRNRGLSVVSECAAKKRDTVRLRGEETRRKKYERLFAFEEDYRSTTCTSRAKIDLLAIKGLNRRVVE